MTKAAELDKRLIEAAEELKTQYAGNEPELPSAWYCEDGDYIEFLFDNDAYRAERVDELLTVYRSRESGEIIGSMLKRVGQIVADNPWLHLHRDDITGVRISHLLLVEKRGICVTTEYREVFERAANSDADFVPMT